MTDTQPASKGTSRPWDFTPPKFMNTIMTAVLRAPLLHRVISSQMMLITFTGKKSGKRYTTPVGYLREGDSVTFLTKRFRQWWRNFQEAAPVELRIEGKDYKGIAQAITDETSLLPLIAHSMEVHPRETQIYEVGLDANGKPKLEDLRALAPKVVVVHVTLLP